MSTERDPTTHTVPIDPETAIARSLFFYSGAPEPEHVEVSGDIYHDVSAADELATSAQSAGFHDLALSARRIALRLAAPRARGNSIDSTVQVNDLPRDSSITVNPDTVDTHEQITSPGWLTDRRKRVIALTLVSLITAGSLGASAWAVLSADTLPAATEETDPSPSTQSPPATFTEDTTPTPETNAGSQNVPLEAANFTLMYELSQIEDQDVAKLTPGTSEDIYETIKSHHDSVALTYAESTPEVQSAAMSAFNLGTLNRIIPTTLEPIDTRTRDNLYHAAAYIDIGKPSGSHTLALLDNVTALRWIDGLDENIDWTDMRTQAFFDQIDAVTKDISQINDVALRTLAEDRLKNLLNHQILSDISSGKYIVDGKVDAKLRNKIDDFTRILDEHQLSDLKVLFDGDLSTSTQRSDIALGKRYADEEALSRLYYEYLTEDFETVRNLIHREFQRYIEKHSHLALIDWGDKPFRISPIPSDTINIFYHEQDARTTIDIADTNTIHTQIGYVQASEDSYDFVNVGKAPDSQAEAWNSLLSNVGPLISEVFRSGNLRGIAVVLTPSVANQPAGASVLYDDKSSQLILSVGSTESPASFAAIQNALASGLLRLLYETSVGPDLSINLCDAGLEQLNRHAPLDLQQHAADLEAAAQQHAANLDPGATAFFTSFWNSGTELPAAVACTSAKSMEGERSIAGHLLQNWISYTRTSGLPGVDHYDAKDASAARTTFPDFWQSITKVIDRTSTDYDPTVFYRIIAPEDTLPVDSVSVTDAQTYFDQGLKQIMTSMWLQPDQFRPTAANGNLAISPFMQLTMLLAYTAISQQHSGVAPFLDNQMQIAIGSSIYSVNDLTPDQTSTLSMLLHSHGISQKISGDALQFLPEVWAKLVAEALDIT